MDDTVLMFCSDWRYLWHACAPVTKIRVVYWPRHALQNYLKIMRDADLTDLQHWRHRLTCRLSSLNCLVILARQQMIKTQRWPTKVPLYLTVSKTTSLPSLPSPPVSKTQSESQVRTLSAGCHKHNTDEGQTTLLGGGTALWPKTVLMIHSLHR